MGLPSLTTGGYSLLWGSLTGLGVELSFKKITCQIYDLCVDNHIYSVSTLSEVLRLVSCYYKQLHFC